MKTKLVEGIVLGLLVLCVWNPAGCADGTNNETTNGDDTSGDGDTDTDTGTSDGDPDNDARLTWDQNQEDDLAGYKVHYGTAPNSYDTIIDVGYTSTPASPEYTVFDLAPGSYYFAITAYDYSGNESAHSNEGSKTIL